jgi:hypothetical protein
MKNTVWKEHCESYRRKYIKLLRAVLREIKKCQKDKKYSPKIISQKTIDWLIYNFGGVFTSIDDWDMNKMRRVGFRVLVRLTEKKGYKKITESRKRVLTKNIEFFKKRCVR